MALGIQRVQQRVEGGTDVFTKLPRDVIPVDVDLVIANDDRTRLLRAKDRVHIDERDRRLLRRELQLLSIRSLTQGKFGVRHVAGTK